jgi:hypothetical protein
MPKVDESLHSAFFTFEIENPSGFDPTRCFQLGTNEPGCQMRSRIGDRIGQASKTDQGKQNFRILSNPFSIKSSATA